MRLLSEHEKEQKQRSGRLRASAPFSHTPDTAIPKEARKDLRIARKKGLLYVILLRFVSL